MCSAIWSRSGRRRVAGPGTHTRRPPWPALRRQTAEPCRPRTRRCSIAPGSATGLRFRTATAEADALVLFGVSRSQARSTPRFARPGPGDHKNSVRERYASTPPSAATYGQRGDDERKRMSQGFRHRAVPGTDRSRDGANRHHQLGNRVCACGPSVPGTIDMGGRRNSRTANRRRYAL